MPRTDDFDQSFVSTFALPEFRTIHSASAQAVSRVASIVRLYSDLPEDTAVAIPSDEVFLSTVVGADENDAALRDLIESAIADEAKRLKDESDRLRDELTRQVDGNTELAARLASSERVANEHLAALRRVEDQIEDEKKARKQVEEEAARRTHDAEAVAEQQRIRAERAEELHRDAVRRGEERDGEVARKTALITRQQRLLLGLAHVVLALLVVAVTPRLWSLTSGRRDILFVGCVVYAVVAGILEQLTWFQQRAQVVAARIFWAMAVASGVAVRWFGGINDIRTQLAVAGALTVSVAWWAVLFSAPVATETK